MITNKDIRVENGNLVLNGDKFPLDGQSPEAIMQIVKDNSDTTPTENSTAPITSGGIKTYVDDLAGVKTGVITLNTGWNFGEGVTNNVKKMGDIAWLSSYIYSTDALTVGTSYEIGTLPADFTPTKTFKFPLFGGLDSQVMRGRVEIQPTGKILYLALEASRYAIYSTIMYPLT